MEALNVNDYGSAKAMLLQAQKIDPDYVQTYIGLIHAYGRPQDRAMATDTIKNEIKI